MVSEAETYDIIFAGGGATACVTAGRLAEADPSLKILIIEAGPHTREIQEHIQPGRYFSNLTLPGETFTFHVANPSDALAGRSVIVPSGRALGGGSSVNFAIYTRAAASDYDDWETTYGNKGWGSKELIPLSKKAETYQAEVFNDTHGSSGPIKVSMAASQFNVGQQFLDVVAAYDKDRKISNDINAFFSCNEYGRWARYIDGKSGRRSDAPHHYIYPQEKNANLKILDRQRVVRVIFEGDRAVGVEYVSDIAGRRQNVVQTPNVARASQLVVIAAGAFGSPSILERSGIGAAEVLKKNNIQQFIDLPGVGENYMDHNLVFVPYIASDDADTMDVIFRGSEDELEPYVKEWTENGKGLMAHNALDAGIKLRPTAEDLKELGPEFENRWKTYFADKPDKSIMLMGSFAAYTGLNPAAPRRKYFSMTYFTAYPASTGHVHIISGIDPYGKLDFSPGFLDNPADLVVLRWVYKKSREIARRMQMYRGEFDLGHPSFADDKEAAIKLADGPVSISASNIRYTPEDDKAIDDYHRQTVETTWHSIGTCAMKPREQGGVVNERLNVYGVRNLKVADLSITPDNVGGNTYNTALTVGEKAAVIIAEDLGIKGVTVV